MKKIPTWIWVTGGIVGIWYLSKPKGAAANAPAGSLDAGRARHVHLHPRGFVGHSLEVSDYGSPVTICTPPSGCVPCRCG